MTSWTLAGNSNGIDLVFRLGYSSKQIRMEASHVISRTFTFTVIGPGEPCDFVIAPPGDQEIFKNGFIRNTLVRTKVYIGFRTDPDDGTMVAILLDNSSIVIAKFLVIAKELGTEDMILDVLWIRSRILKGSEWYDDDDELSLYPGPWDAGWSGRSPRIKVTITIEGSPQFEWGDKTPAITKQMEDFAKSLVGRGAEVARFELPASSYPRPEQASYRVNRMTGIVVGRMI